jgi:hypothetical protein
MKANGSNLQERLAWDEIKGAVCKACGASKTRYQPLCHECYFSIPSSMRRKLFVPFKDGGAQLYYDIVAFIVKRREGFLFR